MQLPALNADQKAAIDNANAERRGRGLPDWDLADFIECHPFKFKELVDSGTLDMDKLRAENAARRGAPVGAAAAPGAVAPAAQPAPVAVALGGTATAVDLKAPASRPGDGLP